MSRAARGVGRTAGEARWRTGHRPECAKCSVRRDATIQRVKRDGNERALVGGELGDVKEGWGDVAGRYGHGSALGAEERNCC